jgi:hypothetical protein
LLLQHGSALADHAKSPNAIHGRVRRDHPGGASG